MGYDLHITRAEYWAENSGEEISPDEWLRLVETDSTLSISSDNGPYFADIESPSGELQRWLDWREGNIVTTWPDRVTVQKMLEIADRLGASVQGDDGERYRDASEIPERPARAAMDESEPDPVPAYVRRERRWDWIAYALIALAVIAANVLDLW